MSAPKPPSVHPTDDVVSHWRHESLEEGRVSGHEGQVRLPRGEGQARALKAGLSVAICTYQRPGSLKQFLASLLSQQRTPDELIVVDASLDARSERAVRTFAVEGDELEKASLPCSVEYIRVKGARRGLTRQRNLALRLVGREVVCFFDDDVVLGPEVLAEVERAFEEDEEGTFVAVGGVDQRTGFDQMPPRWRLRRALGLWEPGDVGRLSRAGQAVPWNLWGSFDDDREVDILPGYAMCWRTAAIRPVGFDGTMVSYSLGEDIDFSLRTLPLGKKKLLGKINLRHMHEESGRVSAYERGHQAGINYYKICRRHGDGSRAMRMRFLLSQGLDVLRLLVTAPRRIDNAARALGRCVGLATALLGKAGGDGSERVASQE